MNGPARNFRDLVVWQKAHELVLAVYRLTRAFPDHEKFGLTSQIRRAAVSVAANVAEESIARRWDERGAGITHHVFGHVELPRAMRFRTVHAAHHTRQLRDSVQ